MARLVLVLILIGWKNWRESFKPITKRSNRNHVITFDSHLKTALIETNSQKNFFLLFREPAWRRWRQVETTNGCYCSWAGKQRFFCLQLHAEGGFLWSYNGKQPISLVYVSTSLITVITAIVAMRLWMCTSNSRALVTQLIVTEKCHWALVKLAKEMPAWWCHLYDSLKRVPYATLCDPRHDQGFQLRTILV